MCVYVYICIDIYIYANKCVVIYSQQFIKSFFFYILIYFSHLGATIQRAPLFNTWWRYHAGLGCLLNRKTPAALLCCRAIPVFLSYFINLTYFYFIYFIHVYHVIFLSKVVLLFYLLIRDIF